MTQNFKEWRGKKKKKKSGATIENHFQVAGNDARQREALAREVKECEICQSVGSEGLQ